jgi:hypothetical protein
MKENAIFVTGNRSGLLFEGSNELGVGDER